MIVKHVMHFYIEHIDRPQTLNRHLAQWKDRYRQRFKCNCYTHATIKYLWNKYITRNVQLFRQYIEAPDSGQAFGTIEKWIPVVAHVQLSKCNLVTMGKWIPAMVQVQLSNPCHNTTYETNITQLFRPYIESPDVVQAPATMDKGYWLWDRYNYNCHKTTKDILNVYKTWDTHKTTHDYKKNSSLFPQIVFPKV